VLITATTKSSNQHHFLHYLIPKQLLLLSSYHYKESTTNTDTIPLKTYPNRLKNKQIPNFHLLVRNGHHQEHFISNYLYHNKYINSTVLTYPPSLQERISTPTTLLIHLFNTLKIQITPIYILTWKSAANTIVTIVTHPRSNYKINDITHGTSESNQTVTSNYTTKRTQPSNSSTIRYK
jgi:hypothetical protein